MPCAALLEAPAAWDRRAPAPSHRQGAGGQLSAAGAGGAGARALCVEARGFALDAGGRFAQSRAFRPRCTVNTVF